MVEQMNSKYQWLRNCCRGDVMSSENRRHHSECRIFEIDIFKLEQV